MALLEVRDLHAHYGRIHALRGVSLTVEEGEIVTLIGANGAGKSTLLMSLCGAPKPSAGSAVFDGVELVGKPTGDIVRLGIAQSPEGRRVFGRMTVLENLQMGATLAPPAHFQEDLERIYTMFPRLKERSAQRAGTLSGGEQQMLAIGRALMQRPRLLMLDEPSLGLAPLIIRQIFDVVRDLNARAGVTILLVEQNAHHALRVAHRAYVLQHGEVVMQGSGAELLANPDIRAAYLEGGAH